MNDYNKKVLQSGLNFFLENCTPKIEAKHLYTYSKHDNTTIKIALDEWEKRGLIKILKPYEECLPEEYCVKMLSFIDSEPPYKDFWDNKKLIAEILADD